MEEISFRSESKETMKDRLLHLIGTRSRRQAADDWGIKYATLNNYLTARESQPRPNVVKQIADAEGVDSNWILYGVSSQEKETARATPLKANVQFICDMMSVLSESETESLRNVLIREGIKTLLALTEEDNLHLINLNQRQKKAALMLEHLSDEKVREILQGDASSATNSTVNIANSKG
jgi:hypothetical protein